MCFHPFRLHKCYSLVMVLFSFLLSQRDKFISRTHLFSVTHFYTMTWLMVYTFFVVFEIIFSTRSFYASPNSYGFMGSTIKTNKSCWILFERIINRFIIKKQISAIPHRALTNTKRFACLYFQITPISRFFVRAFTKSCKSSQTCWVHVNNIMKQLQDHWHFLSVNARFPFRMYVNGKYHCPK